MHFLSVGRNPSNFNGEMGLLLNNLQLSFFEYNQGYGIQYTTPNNIPAGMIQNISAFTQSDILAFYFVLKYSANSDSYFHYYFTGVRTNIVVFRAGTYGGVYINNVLAATNRASIKTPISYQNSDFVIGKDYRDDGYFYSGELDNLAIYPSVLTDTQRTALYNKYVLSI